MLISARFRKWSENDRTHAGISSADNYPASPRSAQADDHARSRHANKDLQGARRRDRDADGVRGDDRSHARAIAGNDTARTHDWLAYQREEAHTRTNPSSRTGNGGRNSSTGSGSRVGHIGLYRDHDTLQPVDYYFKVPGDVAERDFFVLDPMLATGGSAAAAVNSLKRAGATRIRFLCLVAAPEGVRRLSAEHPDVQIYCAALDRELNQQGYILPGLGDAGDRLFGTR